MNMTITIFKDLLLKKDYKTIQNILNVMNAVDIALLLSELEDKELAIAFRLIPKDEASDVFSNMSSTMQAYLVEIFTEKELKELLDNLYMDDTVDMLGEFPANAMRHIKEVGIHKETIYTCYVLERRKLIGIVTAKDLMTMDDDTKIGDIMETEIISVHTHTDQEEAARLFSKYDFLALPVLDADGLMVGIITVDDAIDVVVDEATEDMTVMAAVTPSEKSYFDTSVFAHAKNRFVWLLVLMFSATITGTIITRYENAFAAVPLLVSFIPMLMDTGGNCGSQSSTLIIRGLALDEIKFKDIFRVIFKEFRIALLVGIGLAIANGIRIFIMYKDLKMAIVIALSLSLIVIIAKIIGCTLPLFAKKLHMDPAIMASPLITTVVDTCSIMIYFSIATRVFTLS